MLVSLLNCYFHTACGPRGLAVQGGSFPETL